jgi:hypothetical protein
MKVTKVLIAGIAALVLAASAATATATLTAAPARAVCSDQTPFDCRDPAPQPGGPLQGFICGGSGITCGPAIPGSQLPPGIGPDGGQDWGRGLPCSTDPRFVGCPGATPDQNFLADMARAGITSSSGPQLMIKFAHDVCSDLAHGNSYDHEVNILTGGTHLDRDHAIRLVEDSREFYCPTL